MLGEALKIATLVLGWFALLILIVTLCKVAKLQIDNHESDEIKKASVHCTEPLMKSGRSYNSTLLSSSTGSLERSHASMCD